MTFLTLSHEEFDFFLLLSKESLYVVKSKLLSFVFIFPQLSVCLVTLLLLIFDTQNFVSF